MTQGTPPKTTYGTQLFCLPDMYLIHLSVAGLFASAQCETLLQGFPPL